MRIPTALDKGRHRKEAPNQPTHTNKHTEFEDHQCRGRERERGIILEAKKWVPRQQEDRVAAASQVAE